MLVPGGDLPEVKPSSHASWDAEDELAFIRGLGSWREGREPKTSGEVRTALQAVEGYLNSLDDRRWWGPHLFRQDIERFRDAAEKRGEDLLDLLDHFLSMEQGVSQASQGGEKTRLAS